MTDTEQQDGGLLELAYPYALDAVAELERRRIENQLCTADPATAAAFMATVGRVHETMAQLSALDQLAPPERVEADIAAALDRLQDSSESPSAREDSARASRRFLRRGGWLGVAAAVIVAAAVGTAVFADRSDQPARDQTVAQVLEQSDGRTRSAVVAGGGTLEVSSSVRLGIAAVAFKDVPEPPSGRAYQLWLVAPGVAPRSAGVLAQLPSTSAPVSRFSVDDSLAITMEPATGSPQPTSAIIAAVELG